MKYIPNNGVITNTQDIEFAEASGDWGTITHYVLYDSLTGGNLLMYEAFPTGKQIQEGSQARFKINSLKFTISNPA